MKKLSILTLFCGLSLFSHGCSEETQEKAGDAAKATGAAVESAAEDAAKNTKEAAAKVEESLEGDNDADTP